MGIELAAAIEDLVSAREGIGRLFPHYSCISRKRRHIQEEYLEQLQVLFSRSIDTQPQQHEACIVFTCKVRVQKATEAASGFSRALASYPVSCNFFVA